MGRYNQLLHADAGLVGLASIERQRLPASSNRCAALRG